MFSFFPRHKNVFIRKMLISFLFLHENICCGYSLEASQQGASNEYPQHMFSWRNKKNIMWIPRLICSYVLVLFGLTIGSMGAAVQGIVFFFFYLGFTALSRIFHLYRADRSSKVGENRRTLGITTWPSASWTWLSHMWPERGSNHSGEKPNGLRVSSLIH